MSEMQRKNLFFFHFRTRVPSTLVRGSANRAKNKEKLVFLAFSWHFRKNSLSRIRIRQGPHTLGDLARFFVFTKKSERNMQYCNIARHTPRRAMPTYGTCPYPAPCVSSVPAYRHRDASGGCTRCPCCCRHTHA